MLLQYYADGTKISCRRKKTSHTGYMIHAAIPFFPKALKDDLKPLRRRELA